MTDAIRLDRLVKHYGATQALRGIDLRVMPGEVFGFLGPNGAGKSTAIRILLDLIRPTAGAAQIFGHDCQADSVAARAMAGYLPSSPVFPSKMTGAEVFEYVASVRHLHGWQAERDRLVERLRLDTGRPVSELSRGNQQKVGLIQALLPRSPLVILDEPTTGLDPLMQAEVKAILREVVAEGRTVFFSSHILQEVESICDRAAIIRDGALVDVLDLAEQRRLAPVRVEVTFAEPPAPGAFDTLPGHIRLLEQREAHATFEVREDIDALVKHLARRTVTNLVAEAPTLEEVFVRHYAGTGEGAP